MLFRHFSHFSSIWLDLLNRLSSFNISRTWSYTGFHLIFFSPLTCTHAHVRARRYTRALYYITHFVRNNITCVESGAFSNPSHSSFGLMTESGAVSHPKVGTSSRPALRKSVIDATNLCTTRMKGAYQPSGLICGLVSL